MDKEAILKTLLAASLGTSSSSLGVTALPSGTTRVKLTIDDLARRSEGTRIRTSRVLIHTTTLSEILTALESSEHPHELVDIKSTQYADGSYAFDVVVKPVPDLVLAAVMIIVYYHMCNRHIDDSLGVWFERIGVVYTPLGDGYTKATMGYLTIEMTKPFMLDDALTAHTRNGAYFITDTEFTFVSPASNAGTLDCKSEFITVIEEGNEKTYMYGSIELLTIVRNTKGHIVAIRIDLFS